MGKIGIYDVNIPPFPNGDDIKIDRKFYNYLLELLKLNAKMDGILIDMEEVQDNPKDGYKHRYRQNQPSSYRDDCYNNNKVFIDRVTNKKVDTVITKQDFSDIIHGDHIAVHANNRLNIARIPVVRHYSADELASVMPDGKITKQGLYFLYENLIKVYNWLRENNGRYFNSDGYCILSCQISCQEGCQVSKQIQMPDKNCKKYPDGISDGNLRRNTDSTYYLVNRSRLDIYIHNYNYYSFDDRVANICINFNNNIANLNKQYQQQDIPVILPFYCPVTNKWVVYNESKYSQDSTYINNIIKNRQSPYFYHSGYWSRNRPKEEAGLYVYGINVYGGGYGFFGGNFGVKSSRFAIVNCSNDYVLTRDFGEYGQVGTHNTDYYNNIKYPNQIRFYWRSCDACESCSNK